MAVCRQCAITSNVGHAFSIVLLHQKLCSERECDEEWEWVTAERGHWATLYSNLEILVHLCNVVGLDALRKLPFVPFEDLPEHKDDEHKDDETCYVVDPANLKLKFFNKGSLSGTV